jgi:hypothetical protein
VLARFDVAAEGEGPRLAVCQALDAGDADAFEDAFGNLLRARELENEEDKARAAEEAAVAVGTKVFVEGIAVLTLARRAGIPIARDYPMCPMLALLPTNPATPPDEFASP